MPSQVPLPKDTSASHPGLIQTVFKPDDFASYAVSLVALPAGARFATFEHATKTPHASYASVQTGRDEHMLLNSDLLYTNHSCRPNLEFDVDKGEVRVAKDKDTDMTVRGGAGSPINVGDKMTFFYPSTEWDMSQPFDCSCGEAQCLGTISGAKHIDRETLKRYFLNQHIHELLAEDVQTQNEQQTRNPSS